VIRSSKKARQRRSLVIKLDKLAREECFVRDGHLCVRCGSANVQWSHIIGRRHLRTRWELDNALSLCPGCHRFWHEQPLLSGPWFKKNWPERAEHILALFNGPSGPKTAKDLQELIEDFSDPPSKSSVGVIKDCDIPF
jgi:5-methylcytosine-specific restriction endonuclease McrA